MAARTWFTPEICEGLSSASCAVLNTAARHRFSTSYNPSLSELGDIRMAYQDGMSARDILNKLDEEDIPITFNPS